MDYVVTHDSRRKSFALWQHMDDSGNEACVPQGRRLIPCSVELTVQCWEGETIIEGEATIW